MINIEDLCKIIKETILDNKDEDNNLTLDFELGVHETIDYFKSWFEANDISELPIKLI